MVKQFRLPLHFALILTICFSSISAYAWTGKVVSVSDGDTIKVLHDGKEEKIRLYGIDTPEKGQAFGQKAGGITSSFVAGKIVDVEPKDTDRYGRTVAMVNVDGVVLNEIIIQKGYAWVYPQYCKESVCAEWSEIESLARDQKMGMWVDPHIMPPWEWRHGSGGKGGVTLASSQVATPDTTIAAASGEYHGNIRSKKFHQPGCRVYDCKNCIATFTTREAAMSAGYVPCKLCNP